MLIGAPKTAAPDKEVERSTPAVPTFGERVPPVVLRLSILEYGEIGREVRKAVIWTRPPDPGSRWEIWLDELPQSLDLGQATGASEALVVPLPRLRPGKHVVRAVLRGGDDTIHGMETASVVVKAAGIPGLAAANPVPWTIVGAVVVFAVQSWLRWSWEGRTRRSLLLNRLRRWIGRLRTHLTHPDYCVLPPWVSDCENEHDARVLMEPGVATLIDDLDAVLTDCQRLRDDDSRDGLRRSVEAIEGRLVELQRSGNWWNRGLPTRCRSAQGGGRK